MRATEIGDYALSQDMIAANPGLFPQRQATRKPRQHPEADLRESIRQIAVQFHWYFYFTHNSRHSPQGWVDVVLCRPPRLILAELKSEKGKLTPYQEAWGIVLRDCPQVEYYIWRPGDIEEIIERLR